MKHPHIQCIAESGYVSLVLKKRRHYTKAQALAISINRRRWCRFDLCAVSEI